MLEILYKIIRREEFNPFFWSKILLCKHGDVNNQLFLSNIGKGLYQF